MPGFYRLEFAAFISALWRASDATLSGHNQIHGFSSALFTGVHYRNLKKFPGTRHTHLDHHTKLHHLLRSPACENCSLIAKMMLHRASMGPSARRHTTRRALIWKPPRHVVDIIHVDNIPWRFSNQRSYAVVVAWKLSIGQLAASTDSHNGMHILIDE